MSLDGAGAGPRGSFRRSRSGSPKSLVKGMPSASSGWSSSITGRSFHPIGFALKKAEEEFKIKQEQNLQQLLRERTGFGLFAVLVLNNKNFDMVMGLVISANVAIMVVQANENSACEWNAACERSSFVSALSYVFLGIYSVELVLRLASDRLGFIFDRWNLLDFTVVMTGWIDTVLTLFEGSFDMPGFSILRIFRVIRLLRAVRLMRFFPSLAAMITGCMSVMKAMSWGIVLIFLFLITFSIATVDVVGPFQQSLDESSDWCDTAFTSVYTAVLFFFQIFVAGDSWGACAIPLVLENWWLFFVFGICFFIVEFGIMNLVLSAIIDCATESHEQDVEQRANEVRAEKERAVDKLKSIFQVIDADRNDHLSSEEMLDAWETNDNVRNIFSLHDICDKDEMRLLFRYMDKDRSDSVNIDEFTTCLRRAMQQDVRMQMMCVKLHLESLQSNVEKGFWRLEDMISSMSKGEEVVPPPKTPKDGQAPAGAQEVVHPPKMPKTPSTHNNILAVQEEDEEEGQAAPERERRPSSLATAVRVTGALRSSALRAHAATECSPPAQEAERREEASQGALARAPLSELEERAAGEEARQRELEVRCREARDKRSAAEALLRLAGNARAVSEPPPGAAPRTAAAARPAGAAAAGTAAPRAATGALDGQLPQDAERLYRLAAEAEAVASRRLSRHARGGAPQDVDLLHRLAAEARFSADRAVGRGQPPPDGEADDEPGVGAPLRRAADPEGGLGRQRPDAPAPRRQQHQSREQRQQRPRTTASDAPPAGGPRGPARPRASTQVAQAAQAAHAIQANWHAAAAAPGAAAAAAPPPSPATGQVAQPAVYGFGFARAAVLASAGPPPPPPLLLPAGGATPPGLALHHGFRVHAGSLPPGFQHAAPHGEAWGAATR